MPRPGTDRETASWTRTASDYQAVAEGCYFDLAKAKRVKHFIETFLCHSKGQWANEKFKLLPWQWESVIGPLFGWCKQNGRRRFTRAYVEIPKKNGKTTLAAAIALFLVLADGEAGAEIYSAAADREQAGLVFRECASMVRASPELGNVLEIVESRKRIVSVSKASFYQALSADVPTKEGLNAHAIIFDELHAQKSPQLYESLRYASAARRQPLFFSISTAGYDRETICYEQHLYAEQIISGVTIDTSFHGVIFAADENDDWTDPKIWRKANPSLGHTLQEEDFAADFNEAKLFPSKQNAFRRYRLNQWTTQDVRWIDMDKWDACKDPIGELEGRDCYAGLDLSTTTDLSAMVLVFPVGESYSVLPFFWVPEEAGKRRERLNKTRYDAWISAGHIDATPGDVIDYDRIRAKINELARTYNIREIAIDRWNSTQLATQLQGDGFNVIGFGQGFASMSAPTKELEKLILAKQIRHGANPVLRWCANNCSVEIDAAGNLKPSKKTSREKIDGVVAGIMALGRAMLQSGQSVYDQRGLEVL